MKFQIVFRKDQLPTRLPGSQLLRSPKVDKVFMIREYYDLFFSSKEMSPCFQGSDDGEELSIINLIVSFGGVQ